MAKEKTEETEKEKEKVTIIERIKDFFFDSSEPIKDSIEKELFEPLRGDISYYNVLNGEVTSRNLFETENKRDISNYWGNLLYPEMYFVCNQIANYMAQLPVNIYQDKQNNILSTQDSIKNYLLNNRANDLQSAFDFWHNMWCNMLYYGVAFAKIIVDKDGYYSIYVLDNSSMTRISDEQILYSNDINANKWNAELIQNSLDTGESVLFNNYDLITFKYDHNCSSPFDWLKRDLRLVNELKNGMKNNINAGSTQLLIKSKHIDKSSAEELKEHTNITRMLQSKRPFAMPLGGINSEVYSYEIKANPQIQTDLKEIRKRINEYLGFPDGLIGGDSNQGKAELMDLLYSKFSPHITKLEQEIENKLFPTSFAFSGGGVKFDTTKLLDIDIIKKTSVLQQQIDAGIITINEARKKLGFVESSEEICNLAMPKLEFNVQRANVAKGGNDNGTTE